MSRPVTLFTVSGGGPASRRTRGSLRRLGIDGLERACWGDHFEVDRVLVDDTDRRERTQLLERHGRGCRCAARTSSVRPQTIASTRGIRRSCRPRCWGDGEEEGVGVALPSG